MVARDVAQLASLVTKGQAVVQLDASNQYNFSAAVPTLGVPAAANVTVRCNGATLRECDACGRFYNVGPNATLSLVNCTIINRALVPYDDIQLPSTSAPSQSNSTAAASPLDVGASIYVRDSGLISPFDCSPVEAVTFLVNGLGAGQSWIQVGYTNATYSLLLYFKPPLADPAARKAYVLTNTYVGCYSNITLPPATAPAFPPPAQPFPPPRSASPSTIAAGVVAVIALATVFVLAVVLGFLAGWWWRRRRRRQEESPTLAGALPPRKDTRSCSDLDLLGKDVTSSVSTPSVPTVAVPSTPSSSSEDDSRSAPDMISRAIRELKDQLRVEQLQIHEVIAKGGFGVVYTGTWRGLNVAIKTVIFHSNDVGTDSMKRAAAEASIAYNLIHPNIVHTYSHELKSIATEHEKEISSWRLYLVQELCNGGTLTKYVEAGHLRSKHGGVLLGRILTLLTDVARGMEHLHAKRIAHGDLNPNNILLQVERPDEPLLSVSKGAWRVPPKGASAALDSGHCAAKITDFGLSIRLEHDRSHVSNVKHGTPFYSAPELAQEHRLLQESDVYSYGVIMWSLCNSCAPYVWRDGVLERHPDFPAFQHYMPLNYVLLSVACMSRDPEERPTFAQILDVLEGIRLECASESYVDAEGLMQRRGNSQFQPDASQPLGSDHLLVTLPMTRAPAPDLLTTYPKRRVNSAGASADTEPVPPRRAAAVRDAPAASGSAAAWTTFHTAATGSSQLGSNLPWDPAASSSGEHRGALRSLPRSAPAFRLIRPQPGAAAAASSGVDSRRSGASGGSSSASSSAPGGRVDVLSTRSRVRSARTQFSLPVVDEVADDSTEGESSGGVLNRAPKSGRDSFSSAHSRLP